MSTGVILLSFGEPPAPTRDTVEDYLTRIFLANAQIEDTPHANLDDRARALAKRRAPGLLAEYEQIDGSPLNRQVTARADSLESELRARGFSATTYVGFQYTEPSIEDALTLSQRAAHDHLIALPLYPLCGPSTTIAALTELTSTVAELEWDVPLYEITGWHRHPIYNRIRADNITQYTRERDLDLTDADTTLVFSAHGTPQYYVDHGSNYTEYVDEYAIIQAALLTLDTYELGYQNHENRDVPWTDPTVESVVSTLDTTTVVVEPMSFIHEQSETLSELDLELRHDAEAHDLSFHRVPVPHDDDRFDELFADLLEPFIADFTPAYYSLNPCRCRPNRNTYCLNASVPDDNRVSGSASTIPNPE